jgi:hypothetical protein
MLFFDALNLFLQPCNTAARELLQGMIRVFSPADFYEFFQPSALPSECGGQVAKLAHDVSPPRLHYTSELMSKSIEKTGHDHKCFDPATNVYNFLQIRYNTIVNLGKENASE